MTPTLLASNILTYSLQVALLAAAAFMVGLLLKFEAARMKLVYWQLVLLACLMLPVIHRWKQVRAGGDVQITMGPATALPQQKGFEFPFTAGELMLGLLGAGVLGRLALLGIGFWRLRRYRIYSQPLTPVSSWGAEADLRISDEVTGPVTFGWLRPVVLLPPNFLALDEAVREAVLCHEILHVRRNDWLFTAAEELVRAVFWFHPAIWWVIGELQLAREQAVDQAAVAITKTRNGYVDALLAIAGAASRLDVAPAPLFLRRRHLKRRVVSILKEVRMSKTRTISAMLASVAMLSGACWILTASLPLEAAPQTAADATEATAQAVSLHRITILGLSDQQKTDVLAHLNDAGVRVGQQLSPEGLRLTAETIANSFGEQRLRVQVRRIEPNQIDLYIVTPEAAQLGSGTDFPADAHPIRVGAAVAEQNMISRATPVYPPLAKAARVQGTVKIDILINKEGHVQNQRLVSGPPLLVKSALDAVQQWVYQPTLLNGQPVEVATTVDVTFTLSY